MDESFAGDYLPGLEDQDEDEQSDPRLSEHSKGPFREQDIYLPIANVARIMKSAVPSNGKIAKDAKECVQECVSEFISFITSEASERCAQEKRKTINGEDVLYAMATLGFDPYIEPLKIYLQKYRDFCFAGTLQPYTLRNLVKRRVNEAEDEETLKAEKIGSIPDSQDVIVNESDLVDHFAPTQFADMLVTSESSNVFSDQTSNLESQMQFNLHKYKD